MFKVSDTLLRTLGLSDIHSVFDKTPANKKKNEMVFSLTFAAVFFSILGLVNKAIHEWDHDPYNTLEIIPMIFTTILGWFAGILMHSSTKKIKELLEDLKSSWTRELREGVNDMFIDTARRSIFFTVFYAILIFTLGALYIILPIARRIHHLVFGADNMPVDSNMGLLFIRYPFKVDSVPRYILCTIFEFSCTLFLMISYLGVDTLFHQSTTIVSLLLETVGNKFGEMTLYSNLKTFDRRLLRRLNHVGEQHCELLSYCRRIEEIFNPLIYLTTLLTSANLCVCVISLRSELSKLQLGSAFVTLVQVVAIISQPLIYCNSAENISHWTQNIADTIYSCQWPEQSKSFKKMVQLIMMRAQCNYKFGAHGLFKVNRHLLTQLVHTAWNFFMLLRKKNL
ncbi:odorant receptor 67b [Diachasma alloeum]|uniref:Odorant receptor n=1 Tax=Diachasma alloeum TaxID=454923 RepID=A0A4E0RK59_9HYME|nr:odorant receptor 67b [Diachasma alloeum]THK33142.1 odorant receptor 184 [Diachasma alloeum]